MGGGRTTRAIKNSTLRPIRPAQMNFRLRPMGRVPTKRAVRTRRYGRTPRPIRADPRTRPGTRAAPGIRGLRVAGEVAGHAGARGRAEIAGKVGAAKGIEEGGAQRRQRAQEGAADRHDSNRQDDGRYDEVELTSPDSASVELLGILDVLGSGSGFIRRREAGYTPSDGDIYVGAKVIQKFGLRTGDELSGSVGRKPKSGKSPPLTHLALVNARSPEDAKKRPDFNRLSAVHPSEQLMLACDREVAGEPDYTNRVIDLFCPFGKGQRAMIVSPSKAGKTTVLQSVAEGIVTNNPEIRLMILLADERPEEITDMEMCGFGEVIASSFDRPAERHCQVAEMTLERARRYGRKRGGRRYHPRLHHAAGPGVQYRGRGKWPDAVRWSGRELARKAQAVHREREEDRSSAWCGIPHHHSHRAGGYGVTYGPGDFRGVQRHREQ